jgi:hypothetical protein
MARCGCLLETTVSMAIGLLLLEPGGGEAIGMGSSIFLGGVQYTLLA